MNFNHIGYLPGLLVVFAVFLFVVIRMESRFFFFVKKFWFFKRSIFSYFASFFFLLGMGGLLFSLLDLRGPEQKIKVEAPVGRTIILIDTSASMLAEDVKPSRLQKAALIAKHFARKAAGQQLSIVAFAEIQKKIVPFTTDLDLIDARLDSLKNLRNQNASSALSLAIQESIQYFRETDGEARGNILVLTDGEETAGGVDLKVPKDVRIALVGIGTENGGRIPLDDGRGFRFGYKKDNGRDVITKLNENFFRSVVEDVPYGKYWLANSYSLPSEEILDFFNSQKGKGQDQQDMVTKPVFMEWIVVPSLILICLSYLLKSIRIFTLGLLLVVLPGYSQENAPNLTPEMISRLDELQKGGLNQLEKLKLADDLYKAGAKGEALELYKENLPSPVNKALPPEAYMNYGTALLENREAQKGLEVYQKLGDSLDDSPVSRRLKETMDKNIVTYFQRQEQKKNQKKEDNKEQSNQDQNNQDQNQPSQGQQKDDQNKGSSGNQQQKNQRGQGQNKDQKKDEKDKSDQDKNKDKKEDDQDKDQEKKDENKQDQKDQNSDKKMPPHKIPAKLKQLMSDDRQLQLKMIENSTRDLNRMRSRKSKDW